MKQSVSIAIMMASIFFAGGCATKKYVRQTVDPVSGKLDQVATQTNQQGKTLNDTKQSLDQTRDSLEKDETALNATNERAVSADNRAGQAIDQAGQANQKADKLGSDVGDLRNTVANLDDYKQVAGATLNFKFDSDKLTDDAKRELDQMAGNQNQYKKSISSRWKVLPTRWAASITTTRSAAGGRCGGRISGSGAQYPESTGFTWWD